MQRYVPVLMALAALDAWGFYILRAGALPTWSHLALKGAAVGLLALAALAARRGRFGNALAGVMAACALGDVLLERSQVAGALAFIGGHIIAIAIYRRHGARDWAIVIAAVAVAALAWWMPGNRARAPELALYGLFVGAMTGGAVTARFPWQVGIGAVLFLASDLLIFARLGPLAESGLPGTLIWPLYFAGQLLICHGVLAGLQPATGKRTAPSSARSSGP